MVRDLHIGEKSTLRIWVCSQEVVFEGWPARLLVIRHGESAGNVARELALAQRLPEINLAGRDCDVPLSPLGERQSKALGEWLRAHEPRADAVLTSPFLRAQQTTRIILDAAGWTSAQLLIDERVREKEFGILDRLTRVGIAQRYPEQAAMLTSLGKFYYRPPGGESWTDVILRLRSVIDTLTREWADKRVFIVSHQVVVLSLRYLLEHLTEQEILAIDRDADVANCSITSYVSNAQTAPGGMTLERYNFVTPVQAAGEKVTAKEDVPVAPR